MKPVAEAIDRLQGEIYCYYGYLLPTLVAARRKLTQLLTDERIQYCRPLIDGLRSALERRFQSFFIVSKSCQNAAIAAVSHLKFKTRWLACLDAVTQTREAAVLFGHGEAAIQFLRYLNKPNTDLGMLRDFPIMRSVFFKYNTPLPSSAPVERSFSFATMINLLRYNRLTDSHFEERVLSKVSAKKSYL
ncbi:uncharacterized protein LOC112494168 [Cephus cinctus]|uniref:Uncharacterized protein LOC112494168 n=1 Tax=Cephus cinctus TaxID=211228 RepID=A0AAJ7W015_CEPCN|nr:uncharacterized protein LOC112494168 [Cephus cinctus]